MGFFYFLGQKKFYINLLIAIVLCILLIWVAIKSLDIFTRHGEVYIVPDFSGQTIPQIVEQQYNEFFELVIIDSVFDKKAKKGSVVMQHPYSGSKVKQGRHIYLTIVSESPEMATIPNLKNLSLRQALVTLESFGLEAGTLEYVDYFARNAVVDQLIDNEPVEPGTEVVIGTVIDLNVGLGKMVTNVPIPVLIAMKKNEVKKALNYAYLNIGRQYFLDGEDTAHARVYKTDPLPREDNLIGLGEKVNVWYRSDEYFDFDNYLKEYVEDSLLLENILEHNIIREE